MDFLFKDEIIEDIKNDRLLQAFECIKYKLEEQGNPSSRELYIDWSMISKTKEEENIWERAYNYEEEYFSDMRLIDYKDELFAVQVLNRQLTPEEGRKYIDGSLDLDSSDYTNGCDDGDILDRLSIDGWRFKLVDYEDEFCCGTAIFKEQLVEISNKYNDNDTLIHEMIHIYEFILKSYELDDFVLIRLYDELLPKVKNLKKMISMDKHSLFKEHSLLFILKSIKLDLELGYEEGTIYSMAGRNYIKNYLIRK